MVDKKKDKKEKEDKFFVPIGKGNLYRTGWLGK